MSLSTSSAHNTVSLPDFSLEIQHGAMDAQAMRASHKRARGRHDERELKRPRFTQAVGGRNVIGFVDAC